jgi:hypothetical protein
VIGDTWHWQAGVGKFETGVLHDKRAGGFDIGVDARENPPTIAAAAKK